MKTIKKQLNNLGIEVVSYGYDGDSKFLKSQKSFLKFGTVMKYKEIYVVGDYKNSELFQLQDSFHIAKNMKNRFYDTSDDIKMGKFIASPSHLIIVMKTKSRIEHNISLSDLNPNDRLNYA